MSKAAIGSMLFIARRPMAVCLAASLLASILVVLISFITYCYVSDTPDEHTYYDSSVRQVWHRNSALGWHTVIVRPNVNRSTVFRVHDGTVIKRIPNHAYGVAKRVSDAVGGAEQERIFHTVHVTYCGWPLKWCYMSSEGLGYEFYGGFAVPSEALHCNVDVVPYYIMPMKLLLCVGLVAIALICATEILFALRRTLRRKSGRCTFCGYYINSLSVCPECGRVFVQRRGPADRLAL